MGDRKPAGGLNRSPMLVRARTNLRGQGPRRLGGICWARGRAGGSAVSSPSARVWMSGPVGLRPVPSSPRFAEAWQGCVRFQAPRRPRSLAGCPEVSAFVRFCPAAEIVTPSSKRSASHTLTAPETVERMNQMSARSAKRSRMLARWSSTTFCQRAFQP